MERIVPAPVRRALVVVKEHPLQTFQILLHHHKTLRLSMLGFDIKAWLFEVILALGRIWRLGIHFDEFHDEFAVGFLSSCVNVCLRREQITLRTLCGQVPLILKLIHVHFADALIWDVFSLEV